MASRSNMASRAHTIRGDLWYQTAQNTKQSSLHCGPFFPLTQAKKLAILEPFLCMPENYHLSYLQQLEAESIFILRETVATCEKSVLLYSIGKDSSVLLRLAQKAFAPGKLPFPLLHVDTK